MADASPRGPRGKASPGRAIETPRPSLRQRIQKIYGMVSDILSPARLLVLVGVVVLVPLSLLGGFGAMAEEDLPAVEPNVAVELAPFSLTVTAARYGDELAPVAYPDDGVQYLFLALEVTNTTDDPVPAGILANALSVDVVGRLTSNGAITAVPTIYRTEDSLPAGVFSPGVLVPTVAIWRIDAAVDLPEELTVTLNTQTWRTSTLDGSWGWRDPHAAVRMTLPLQRLKDA